MRKQLTLSILACLLFTTLVSADMNRQTWNSTVAGGGLGSLQDFYAGNLPGMTLDPPPDVVDVIAESWYTDSGRGGQADDYTASLHGWVTIPESGSYTWHVHADDHAILLVSADSAMESLQEVATIDGWTSSAEWDKYATQTSAPIEYAAGEIIAVFAAHREGGGGDNLGIGWTLPGAGSISYITDFVSAEAPATTTARGGRPASGTTDLPYYIEELSWFPGIFAASHNVYFSTNFDDVDTGADAALIAEALTETSLAIATELETTYYWRVDEVNGAPDFTVFPGKVWSFTVENVGNLIENVTATSNSQFSDGTGPENTVNGSGMSGGLHGTTESDMWLSAGLPATIQFDFDQVYVLHEMQVWNQNQVIETLLGFGGKDVIVEVSTNGVDFTDVNVVAPLNQGTGSDGYAANTTIAFNGAEASSVRMTITSGHGFIGQVGLSEVAFSSIPVLPRNLSPANGSDVGGLDVDLSWRAGRFAVEHRVLASQDKSAVVDGSAVVATTADKSHTLSGLDFGSNYFVQVIDVAADGSTYATPIHLFSTPSRGSVDDFESYSDEDGSQIWATWIDGSGSASNGSLVGNGDLGSPETGATYEGGQSLPLHYGVLGSSSLSSVTRTFDPPLDLTAGAPDSLGVRFQGGPKGFTEDADGNITISAAGADIWGSADEFRYAYMSLSGDGSITARVNSHTAVHDWSKVGVMIRETATPESANAFFPISGVNGARYQSRTATGAGSGNDDATLDGVQQNVTRDEAIWLRIERSGDSFTGSYTLEEDPNTWTVLGTVFDIPMGPDDPNDPNGLNDPSVLIGLAITSHSSGNSVTAYISDVSTTGDVSGGWTVEEIGGVHPPSNDAAQVSLAVIDTAGRIATVYHPDFAATNLTDWTLLEIAFSEAGDVDLSSIDRIKVGVRRPSAMGTLFVDDLHVSVSPSPPSAEVVLHTLSDIGVSVDDVVAFVEAEDATALGASWRVVDDPAASGGVRIGSENGDGNDNNTAPGAEWVATYPITVPADGLYAVALRALEAGSDSFWVRIVGAIGQSHEDPDQPDTGWVRFNGIDAPSGLTWDRVHSNDHSNAAVSWTLPAGDFTLEIAKREDGTYVDAIALIQLSLADLPGVSTAKASYSPGEPIVINFTNADGVSEWDWVGIFHADDVHENYLMYIYLGHAIDGSVTYPTDAEGIAFPDGLPAGSYDVRLFWDDSYNFEAGGSFIVE